MKKTNLKISVIVATYNAPDFLDCVLSELISQARDFACEILVADDGSDERTKKIIEKHQQHFQPLLHLWHEDKGFRKTIISNEAIKKASGDYLIFLDGDCVPLSGFLSEHLLFAEKGYFVAGHRVLTSQRFTEKYLKERSLPASFLTWTTLFFKKDTNKWIPQFKNVLLKKITHLIKHPYWRKEKWRFPKGCHFAVFKKDIMAVNGFDEIFEGWGHEDTDLFIRLLHKGIYIKNAKFLISVMHLWHPVSKSTLDNPNYQRQMERAKDPLVIKAVKGIE